MRAARARAPTRDDPAALEREADRAAAAGEWETAVRLRFRAGLLRLDARELIEYRPSLTTGEVAAAVGSPTFERVGADFDAIAYGGRAAGEQDDGREPRGLAARARGGGLRMSRVALPAEPGRPDGARARRGPLAINLLAAAIDALAPSPSGPDSSSFATQLAGPRRVGGARPARRA